MQATKATMTREIDQLNIHIDEKKIKLSDFVRTFNE